ncbi:putative enoyl-CoA hydratase/isomerase [Parvularcula bermudensis HTCC2503]|uniref:Putative enoyl-CoA hydratase/isomerase n=1 Tax=Parvularcula bermudensis (strain ATCC BAA-594 / HTCC2503 / KCTC 12087) TaxID=314260 RepID=E0TI37_PARBH|nr:enoyl-CoA hydratase/isomerase family protein [Parvularcula bermudensis]ADM09376.1 putative enoyl-CoA hydratase/isomerase [Parvularcula bermudensis HTCC2503]
MTELLTETQDGVTTLTLNRPDAMNAFTAELLGALKEAVQEASATAKAIVLRGAGRAFSAGVDLKILQQSTLTHGKVGEAFDGPAGETAKAIRASKVPVIARVHGACFTGALELALHCDFILTTLDTKFGDTHAKFGLRPTWGMSQTLVQAVGLRRARELSFTAKTFSGDEAARWGLANAAFASEAELDAALDDITKRIAANSPGAIGAYKDLFALAAENRPLEDALAEELSREYPQITDSADRLAGFGKK